MIEDYIWDEVSDVMTSYTDKSYESLIERFDNGQKEREQVITNATDQLNRCNIERQRILNVLRKGYITQADAEIQCTLINADQEHWQHELIQAQELQNNSNMAWDAFLSELKNLDRFRFLGFRFDSITPVHRKECVNMLLQEFVLYKDGTIELRFKLPVNENQVADKISQLQPCKLTSYRHRPA